MTSFSQVVLPAGMRVALEKANIDTIEDLFLLPTNDLFHRLPLPSYTDLLSFLQTLAHQLWFNARQCQPHQVYLPFYHHHHPPLPPCPSLTVTSSTETVNEARFPLLHLSPSPFIVHPYEITELVGDRGVGKTTLCLQFALKVLHMDACATVLYLTTTPPFPFPRLLQLVKSSSLCPDAVFSRFLIHTVWTLDDMERTRPTWCSKTCLIVDDVPHLTRHFFRPWFHGSRAWLPPYVLLVNHTTLTPFIHPVPSPSLTPPPSSMVSPALGMGWTEHVHTRYWISKRGPPFIQRQPLRSCP